MKTENKYIGKRVELIFMDDPYTDLKPGDQGTVTHVDGIGSLHVKWDNGSRLALLVEDRYKILD